MKKQKVYKFSLFTIVIGMVILTSFSIACEPSRDVTIENGTNLDLVVFVGSARIAELGPRAQVITEFSAPTPKWTISAKDSSGKTVYSKEWTPNDLVKSNWKVVITP